MYSVVLLTQQVIKSFKRRYEERGARSLLCNTSALACLSPAPNSSIYSASKIAGDYIGFGLTKELAKYKVDVCMWRAAGVNTKALGGGMEENCAMATPEQYVSKAFGMCTSGIVSAWPFHDFMHLNLSNLKDLFGFSITKFVFDKMFGSDKV